MNKIVMGRVYTLIGVISWGLSGACGQYLMNDSSVSPIYLTALRMMIAGLFLTLFACWKQPKQFRKVVKSSKIMGRMLFFGIFGLMLCQLTYLFAIHSSNAGTATVLQYTCPILIVIYVSLKEKTVPTVMEFVAIFCALVGTFIIATHGNPFNLSISSTGLFWGIISAFTYALYTLLPGKLIQQWGSLIVTGLGLLSGGILFYIGSASWQYSVQWQPYTLFAFFGIIGVGTILAYTLYLEGVALIGPVQGSLLASAEPISSVFFSIVLLGEVFQMIDMVGIIFILIAVYIITMKEEIQEKHMQINR
ncbi:EamA family transporter [uncultured Granulicatella sp.]|uniref:DMT family transporter n=1 Tax=uncultured Granulicatella sp. TaxID=316089 RepID=UPI0028D4D962|nr:EamA family transporter [uncultured Granulicatella sp.]